MRECGKGCAARCEEPDFVPVPDRADGVDNSAAFFVLFAEERKQHSHAEIEALEEVETDPEDSDQNKPEYLKKFV
jgi:hypothetical protein